MKYPRRRTLLFIEPCFSSYILLLKAKQKGYRSLVISENSDHHALSEVILNASSSFFQVNLLKDEAVLDLVGQISQKFFIDGVIPGNEKHVFLTAKVAAFCNKPGLTPQPFLKTHKNIFLVDVLKKREILCSLSQGIQKAALPKKEYRIEGLINNKKVYCVGFAEKIMFSQTPCVEGMYILPSEVDTNIKNTIETYLKKTIADLQLTHSPFQATLQLSDAGPLLLALTLTLKEGGVPSLMSYATGIDYCDNILKLLSNQPLALQKTRHLNGGIIFFNAPVCKEVLLKDPHIKEVTLTDGKSGYAIFIHQDYDGLKNLMKDVVKKHLP